MAARVSGFSAKRRIAAAPSAPSDFNARGVVTAPSFALTRPVADRGAIEFTVLAHQIKAEGAHAAGWIAQPMWVCREGSIPLDGIPLHRHSRRFRSRSAAVNHALSRGLRMVRQQRHRKASTAAWAAAVEALRVWMAEAIEQVRAHDESLPLRGLTGCDLFSGGFGGLSMGMVSQGLRIELACEIDAEARTAYLRNFSPGTLHDDICTLDAREMQVDVVTMGLLCQAFSLAGKGLGFDDPKLAEAYRHALRVLGEVDAKVIIIECARRFMTLDGGKHADALIDHLMRSGYRVQHRALDAAAFGVAQTRERSFLVCTRIGLDVDLILGYVFPEEQAPSATVAEIMDADLPATIADADIVLRTEEQPRRAGVRQTVGWIGGRHSQGYRVYSPQSGPGATLTASGGGRAAFTGAYRVKGGARALTPREALRMQGMPEWAEHHPDRRAALRHAGNGAAVPVACALIEQLGAILGGRP